MLTSYVSIFLIGLVSALIATPLVARLALRLNAVDHPNERKVHYKATPRIGGMAIMAAMMLAVLAGVVLDHEHKHLREISSQLYVLLLTSILVFTIGLWDDLKDISAIGKFLGQISAGLILCFFGIRIHSVVLGGFSLSFGWISWPLTLLWIVGITNAVNLVDGLDGLAAGISLVACGVIMVFAFASNQIIMATLMLALLGSLSGFLFFNFNPARVFMGDCGSMFLGFLLAGSSVMCTTKSQTIVGLALPALALGVPIFDTIFSMLRRFVNRRGIMSPDRSHLHHRLLDMGLRHHHVVLLLYALTLITAGLGMFMMVTRDTSTLIVFVGVIVLLIMVFRIVGIVELRNSVQKIRRNLAISQRSRQELQLFEKAQIRLQKAQDFSQWWTAATEGAQDLGATTLRLSLTNRDGTHCTLTWRSPKAAAGLLIPVTIPLQHSRPGSPLELDAGFRVNGSLESAGNRIALFSRLIDENNLIVLHQDHKDTPNVKSLTESNGVYKSTYQEKKPGKRAKQLPPELDEASPTPQANTRHIEE